MDPLDFCCSVSDLDMTIEVNRRNSTSRVYYGLYHSVRNMFSEIPSYYGLRTHENLQEFLMSGASGSGYDHTKLKSICYVLKTVKRLRTDADYILAESYPKNKSDTAIATVNACINKIKAMNGIKPVVDFKVIK